MHDLNNTETPCSVGSYVQLQLNDHNLVVDRVSMSHPMGFQVE
jgi:hypothetical protein